MAAFVLTGAPGAGKTAILRQLEVDGFAVVEEAATDVIALRRARGSREGWRDPGFVEEIVALQRRRERAAVAAGVTTFFDRSPVCTLALSRWGGGPAPRSLLEEVDRVVSGRVFARRVFFVRHQGFVEATAARRISFEESLEFEAVHEQVYRECGFELVEVPAGPLPDRVALIEAAVPAP